jgi:hypothetical protein
MKVKGTVTRVVEGKMYFRPHDPLTFRRIATGNLTASGEIVVDAREGEPHEVGEEGDFEVGGDEDEGAPSEVEDDEKKPASEPEPAT